MVNLMGKSYIILLHLFQDGNICGIHKTLQGKWSRISQLPANCSHIYRVGIVLCIQWSEITHIVTVTYCYILLVITLLS